MRNILLALALGTAALPSIAAAQSAQPQMPPITGTRLDISATGETTRVPDVAIISAGVVTRAPTAGAAIQQNSARMDRVLAALKRAGVAERDVQTSSINLNPEYRYQENKAPELVGLLGLEPGQHPLPRYSQQRAHPRRSGGGRGQPDQRADPDHRQA